MRLGSRATETPVKFQSDTIILISNLAAWTYLDLAVRRLTNTTNGINQTTLNTDMAQSNITKNFVTLAIKPVYNFRKYHVSLKFYHIKRQFKSGLKDFLE